MPSAVLHGRDFSQTDQDPATTQRKNTNASCERMTIKQTELQYSLSIDGKLIIRVIGHLHDINH